ncbi:MAG TPA: hypothetical protein VHD33_02230, partial [Legionellaceae bacterium]|nr:hypothetical protein [Legionellaceae bacterium]
MKSITSKSYLMYGAYLLITTAAIIFTAYVRLLAQWVEWIDAYLNDILSIVFSPTPLGHTLQQMLSLALTPLLIVAIPALIYRWIKGQLPPY